MEKKLKLTFWLVINNTSKMVNSKNCIMDIFWRNVDFASAVVQIDFV